MNTEQMRAVLDKIKQYDKIVIFRHARPDGDAVGSTMGLRDVLRASFPEKDIRLINRDYADYVAFLGEEDEAQPDEFFADALGIVLDTATVERISNPQYALCRELIKIDHHIGVQPYGDVMWVEEHRSSACEMVAALCEAFCDELTLTPTAATEIYTGMVTDSGRFRFRSVSGDTMRLAGMLLDVGIDTDVMYAHLYMKDFNEFKFQSYVYKKMKRTQSGVAYLHVDRAMQRKFNLTGEQASAAVSCMDSIKGSLIWIAFIDGDDGKTRVRLRSRFVTINHLAEKYNGGGHACACGATVQNKKEMRALIADADALLAEYKANNGGWL